MAAQAEGGSGLKVYDKLECFGRSTGRSAGFGPLGHPRHSCGHCLTPLPAQNTPPPNRSGGPSQTRAAYLNTDKRYSLIFWE